MEDKKSFFQFLAERFSLSPQKWQFRAHLIRHWDKVGWFIDRATWEFGIPGRKLKPEPLEKIFPGITRFSGEISLCRPWDRKRGTSIELEELCALLSMVRFIGAEKVIEVGTYDGNTALNLALNLPASGKLVTIDLPEGGTQKVALPVERLNANPSEVIGVQFRDLEAADKIHSVREDTALLNWKSLDGPFDLVFIDGCHDYRYVKNDTEKALTVLREGGILIWHDYNLSGVGRCVDEFSQTHACHWIQGTRMIVCKKVG